MQLYSWQQACLQAWQKNHYRGIVNVVTGAGKTIFALSAMDRLIAGYPDLQVRIVVPTIPLAKQWQLSLLHHVQQEEWRPGIVGGGRHDDPSRHVLIYIINSARDTLAGHIRRDFSLGRHVLLICDECHHYQSKENRKIFGFTHDMKAYEKLYHCLGLSATPLGTGDDRILLKALGGEIYRYNYSQAAKEGVVAPFTVSEVSVSFLADELLKYQELSLEVQIQLGRLLQSHPYLEQLSRTAFMKAVTKIAHAADMDPSEPAVSFLIATFQRKQVTNLALARIYCATAILQQLPASDRVLIFCERIEQARTMYRAVRLNFGNCCALYHSEMTKDARARSMEAFREHRARILISCKCLDEGIDVPDANTAIVMSSTSISRQRIQRLGRIIRRSENKAAACLYYIYIRESTDDSAYLTGLEQSDTFALRYYTADGVFSNELYEYAAVECLQDMKKNGASENQLTEARTCITEGIARADYLLPGKIQEQRRLQASRTHEKNYWLIMKRIGRRVRGD